MRLGLFERRVSGRERALCADVDILLYILELRRIILRMPREDSGHIELCHWKDISQRTESEQDYGMVDKALLV